MIFMFFLKPLSKIITMLLVVILFGFELLAWHLPWSEDEMSKAYESNRENFELVAEFMADYDLSPYLPEETGWADGCVIYEDDEIELQLRSPSEYDGPVVQPDEAVCEATRQLFKRAKIISITKLANTPDFVYFKKQLARPLRDKERGRSYTAKGLAYSAQAGVPPSFKNLELGVGILEPLNEHWYYWYAETPY